MIYKNIEIHNVGELVEEQDGIRLLRAPQKIVDAFDWKEQAIPVNRYSVGVEFRFIMKNESVTIRLKRPAKSEGVFFCNAYVWRGGLQGHWMDTAVNKFVDSETIDLVINVTPPSKTLERLAEKYAKVWNPELIRVVLDGNDYIISDIIGETSPPNHGDTPSETLLTYGSSITFGSSSLLCTYAWNSIIAKYLNMDLRNLGFAGCCGLEPEMAEYLAAEGEKDHWHKAILELGINVLSWEEKLILERSENILKQVAGRNKDKIIYVVSPFYSESDYNNDGRAATWRKLLSETVKKLNFDNVQYIDGLDILDSAEYLTLDCVHPDIYGVKRIADRLLKQISK